MVRDIETGLPELPWQASKTCRRQSHPLSALRSFQSGRTHQGMDTNFPHKSSNPASCRDTTYFDTSTLPAITLFQSVICRLTSNSNFPPGGEISKELCAVAEVEKACSAVRSAVSIGDGLADSDAANFSA
ncbi:hypothetical protein BDR06DRAFT_1009184 [Suillus hirtellus]|nr:hypothetical protein BDR06DRAFT_1009184 [Suillus hirtellus]